MSARAPAKRSNPRTASTSSTANRASKSSSSSARAAPAGAASSPRMAATSSGSSAARRQASAATKNHTRAPGWPERPERPAGSQTVREGRRLEHLNSAESSSSEPAGRGFAGAPLAERCESTRQLVEDDTLSADLSLSGGPPAGVSRPTGGGGGGGTSGSSNADEGLTRNLCFGVLAGAAGASFQHGYNGGVVNAPERLISDFINATYMQRHSRAPTEGQLDLIFALVVSIYCIGGCLGALATALVADKLGRQRGLLYSNLLVFFACPPMFMARAFNSYELLVLGRLLIGLNAGLNAGLAPLYLNEIAPRQLRGALGTIYQLVLTCAILVSNVLGLPGLLGSALAWPYLFAVPLLPAALVAFALPKCAESPKYLLLVQGKELQAQQALAWFRQTSDLEEEMDELRGERELAKSSKQVSLADLISVSHLRRPLTIAIVIMLSQQLSGINAVLFFSTTIFRDAGLSDGQALRATLGMSLVNVMMTLVSLVLIEKAGRRSLHLFGLAGMGANCVLLAMCVGGSSSSLPASAPGPLGSFMAVVAVYLFIASFASGPGSIPWFLVAELFPSGARPLASSLAVAVNWLANFTVSLSFLPLSNLLHGYVFLLFALLLLLFYLFTYYKVPETKGATAEEISALFSSP